MRLRAIGFGIWLIIAIGVVPHLLTESTNSSTHDFRAIILCDHFNVDGKFNLEFNGTKSCSIQKSKNIPAPINFSSLHIDADPSFDTTLPDIKGKIRIDAQPTAQLFIYKEPTTYAEEIYISKIENSGDNAELDFYSKSGQCYMFFGKNTIMYLEKEVTDSKEWVLEIKGEFRIKEIEDPEKDYPTMKDEKIRFTGSLKVESPGLGSSDNLRLDFDFSKNIKDFKLYGGQVHFISGYKYSPNEFMVELDESVCKNEVIADGFRIDMTKNFYTADDFLHDFCIENIKEGGVEKIISENGRLLVDSNMKYSGDTLFPKVKVTAKYFLVSREGSTGDPIVVVSNLESHDKMNPVEFLTGRKYKVEIYFEEFVKDDIIINYYNKDFKDGKRDEDVSTEHCHEYFIRRIYPSSEDESIECFTEIFFQKKDEGNLYTSRTESFFAKVQHGIDIEIDPPLSVEDSSIEVNEKEKFQISRKITLKSETSDPVKIYVFVLAEGFEIESEKSYFEDSLAKGGFMDIYFEMKAPLASYKGGNHKIKIFVLYQMKGMDYYTLYSPGPTQDATFVENIIVKGSFPRYFFFDVYRDLFLIILSSAVSSILYNGLNKIMKDHKKLNFLIVILVVVTIFAVYMVIIRSIYY